MDLGPLFAAAEDAGLRSAVEGVAWAAGALVTVLTAVTMLWNRWPIKWIREQRAEERAESLASAIEVANAPWRAEVREQLVEVGQRLDAVHAQGARTEHDLEQHRAESAQQHQTDLQRRTSRQRHQDAREQAQEERLGELETGLGRAISRLRTVERLATAVARHVGAGPEVEAIVAEESHEDTGDIEARG